MGSVTAMKVKAKRNKQKRIAKAIKEKNNKRNCKNCVHGLCAKNADAVFCSLKGIVSNVIEECDDFFKKTD